MDLCHSISSPFWILASISLTYKHSSWKSKLPNQPQVRTSIAKISSAVLKTSEDKTRGGMVTHLWGEASESPRSDVGASKVSPRRIQGLTSTPCCQPSRYRVMPGNPKRELVGTSKCLVKRAFAHNRRPSLSEPPRVTPCFDEAERASREVSGGHGHARSPRDLALVGADNDELLCDTAEPTLTSIAPDHIRLGELAAEALNELMRGTPSTVPRHRIARQPPFRCLRP